MRKALENQFLEFAYVRPVETRLREVWVNEGFGSPPISIHFAGRHVATIENWSFDKFAKTAKLHHFRVHDIAKGIGMGEPILRGFANALRSEHGVHTLYLWETHQHVKGYVQLFERLGARKTRIVSGGYQEWVWPILLREAARRA